MSLDGFGSGIDSPQLTSVLLVQLAKPLYGAIDNCHVGAHAQRHSNGATTHYAAAEH